MHASSVAGATRAAALLAAASVLLSGLPAQAAERARLPKLAVLDVKATGVIDAKSVSALSAMVASEVGRYPVKVFAGSDLQTLIGFERQKQLMGCSDGACLAEIGGALGVDYLLATEVGEFGGRWLLTVSLLDTKKAVAEPAGEPKPPAASEPKPVRAEPARPAVATEPAAAAAPAVAIAAAVDPGSTRRTAGWALVGGGGVILAGGAVAGIVALTDADAAKARPPTTTSELEAVRGRVNAEMWAANILYGVGAAAAIAGLVVALTAPTAPEAQPSTTVGLAPVAGGGALVVSGGF